MELFLSLGLADRFLERGLIASGMQVFEAYGLSHEVPQALFLIHPDGYIAYRADRLDIAGLGRFLRRSDRGQVDSGSVKLPPT